MAPIILQMNQRSLYRIIRAIRAREFRACMNGEKEPFIRVIRLMQEGRQMEKT